jgi:hypothetical protein
MRTLAIHTAESTRQFLDAMSAQAHRQLAEQSMALHPELAVQAQAHLDLKTVLDLLRD